MDQLITFKTSLLTYKLFKLLDFMECDKNENPSQNRINNYSSNCFRIAFLNFNKI